MIDSKHTPIWDHGLPYKDNNFEYPAVTGLFVSATNAFAPRNDPGGFLLANAVGLGIALLAAIVGLFVLTSNWRRVLYLAAAPALVAYGFRNWDLLPVAATGLALFAFSRRRDFLAGLSLGLGAAAKFYPALFVPVLGLARLKQAATEGQPLSSQFRSRLAVRKLRGLTFGGIAGFALPNVLVLSFAGLRGWAFAWSWQSRRPPNLESYWAWVYRFMRHTTKYPGPIVVTGIQVLSVLVLLLAAVAVIRGELRRPMFRPSAVCFIVLLLYLGTAKFLNPEFMLWLLPFFVLVELPWYAYPAFVVADLFELAAVSWFNAHAGLSQGASYWTFGVAVALRYITFAFLGVLTWTRGRYEIQIAAPHPPVDPPKRVFLPESTEDFVLSPAKILVMSVSRRIRRPVVIVLGAGLIASTVGAGTLLVSRTRSDLHRSRATPVRTVPSAMPSASSTRRDSRRPGSKLRPLAVGSKPKIQSSNVSIDPQRKPGNGSSTAVGNDVSRDGHFVVFVSSATNLVQSDRNGFDDIFLRDLKRHTTTLISISSSGQQADGPSRYPSVSDDGSIVAFVSSAGNLTPSSKKGQWDYYIRDLKAGTTQRVSADAGESLDDLYGAAISGDGRYLVYSDQGLGEIFVFDRVLHSHSRVSVAANGGGQNGASAHPTISRDGRYIAFTSTSTNLVPEGSKSGGFIRDLRRQSTVRATDGNIWLSPGGRFAVVGVGYQQPILVYDRVSSRTRRVFIPPKRVPREGVHVVVGTSVSDDGRNVAYEDGDNGGAGGTCANGHVYVSDLRSGKRWRLESWVQCDEQANESGATISGDGNLVVYDYVTVTRITWPE